MANQYGQQLKIASNRISNYFDSFAKQYGLTGTQMSVIDFVANRPSRQALQRDIEVEFSISRATATIQLQRMESHQLIERFDAQTDARQKMVRLTKKADELYQYIDEYMQNELTDLENNFSQSELDNFMDVLKFFIDRSNQNE